MAGSARDTFLVDRLLRERVGLRVEHIEEAERVRRILAAMERAGFTSDERYADYLRASPRALLDLASEMSVGETYFFRDPDQLRLLVDEILPRLLLDRPRDHVLKIWSAGSSSGEEAYTIAMLLDERGLLRRAQIVGTDISEQSLARARSARYGSWSLRATPALAAQRYFRRNGRHFELGEELKSRVRFERQSLTDLDAPAPGGVEGGFDLIFCKNVLIYFTDAACLQVSERLARMLAIGGTLLTGASDRFFDLPGIWQRNTSTAGVTFTRLDPRASAPALAPAVHRPIDSSLRPPARTRPARLPLRKSSRPSGKLRATSRPPSNEQAVEACRVALREQPTSELLHVRLASLLIELGQHDQAEAVLRTLLYLNNQLALAHFLSGLVWRRLGEPRKAARAYRRAIALCTEQPDDAPVPGADGVSYQGLAAAADEQARILDRTAQSS